MKCVTNLEIFDSTFIGVALDAFFSLDVLKTSSVGGKPSNFNGASHDPLDPEILTFLNGMRNVHIYENKINLILFLLTLDLFSIRVHGDVSRIKHVVKYINKKCNNMRRNNKSKI